MSLLIKVGLYFSIHKHNTLSGEFKFCIYELHHANRDNSREINTSGRTSVSFVRPEGKYSFLTTNNKLSPYDS